MQKSCVLFDLGGVIVNWHNRWFIEEISQQFNLKQEELNQQFNANLKDISTGVIAEKEFWEKNWKATKITRTQRHSRITARQSV